MEAALEATLDSDLLDDEEWDEESCPAREECLTSLFRDAPAGCLYCLAGELLADDDD